METEKSIYGRKSIRAYTDQKISEDDLKDIVKAAQRAPTWVNAQSAKAHVATGDTLEKIRKDHDKWNNDPDVHTDADVPFLGPNDWDKTSAQNIEHKFQKDVDDLGEKINAEQGKQANKIFNAQAVVYLTLPDNYNKWSLFDLGTFAQTLMLAAYDKGIDSIPAFEFIKYPGDLRKYLDISDSEKIIIGIGLGYRDNDAYVNKISTDRMNLDDMMKLYK